MPTNPQHSSRTLDHLDAVSSMSDALQEALLILVEDSALTVDQALVNQARQFSVLVADIGQWANHEAYVPQEGVSRSWEQRERDGDAHQVLVPAASVKYFAHGPKPRETRSMDQTVSHYLATIRSEHEEDRDE